MSALESDLAWAVDILRRGALVAYPTDTLYGLGAHAFMEAAVAAVFAAKGRPLSQGLPLLLADASQMPEVAESVPEWAWRLAEAYWPGGLTLVLPRGLKILPIVTGGSPGVAVRVPNHPVPRELVRRLGAPIIGTSANLSGGPNPTTALQVREQLGSSVQFIIDGGPCPVGLPSTIVDVTTQPPRLLRVGAVSIKDLKRRFPDQPWHHPGAA
jgi:L-threonylcarbamoyladenylate synthase